MHSNCSKLVQYKVIAINNGGIRANVQKEAKDPPDYLGSPVSETLSKNVKYGTELIMFHWH